MADELDENELRLVRELLRDTRSVGAPALLRRLFTLQASDNVTVNSGNTATEGPFTPHEDRTHGHYLLSLKCDSAVDVYLMPVFDAPGMYPPAVYGGLLRRYVTGPPAKYDHYIKITNTTAINLNVYYELWRIPGLLDS